MALKTLIQRFAKADIVRVFSLNAIATLIRMLSGFISVKVIAYVVGPSGVALLGQLQNFVSLALGYSNGGIHNGITKYVAEYKEDEDNVKKFISGAFKMTLFFTALSSITMILFHRYFSLWIMKSEEYGYLFIVFGVTIFMYTLNLLLISILNGYKEFRKYVIINIVGSVFALILIVVLVVLGGIHGALISAVTYQSLCLIVTFWLCRKLPWMKWDFFTENVGRDTIRRYLKYSAMSIVSITLVPISQMFLRGYVMSEISTTEAGWWESMNRISSMYLMIITTSFSVYFLPRLSEIKNTLELRLEIFKCYKFLIPMLVIILLATYVLKRFVILTLFTEEFLPMESLFVWQLAGDFFKVISWVLAYQMLAKAMSRMFIATEVIFIAIRTLLSFILLQYNGIVGLTQGYLINYILYTLAMVYLFRNILFAK